MYTFYYRYQIGLGNGLYFQIVQSCSTKITDRQSCERVEGVTTLHSSDNFKSVFCAGAEEDFIAASVTKNEVVYSWRGIRILSFAWPYIYKN